MKIVDGKALLLTLRNPAKVTAVIPKSRELPNNQVLVNWGLEETQVLRNMNINAPSPIESKYKWTGKYTPFDHQKTTASFFTLNRKAFCFNEQGTGKTASAIWASDYLMKQGAIRRVLVICPLSIMDSAWRNDLFSFAMHRKVDVAYGAKAKRAKIIEGDAEYVIINYDGVEIVADAVANGGFDLIIVDEATHYKNPQTKRWKTLNKLVGPSTWLWMMTGTPAAQSPTDAYGIAKLVNPNGVPRFFGSFRDQVMRKITNFKWAPKEDATTTVHRVLQPAIRFTKDECLDLPPMVYVNREVPLTRQQLKYYKELKNKMVMQAAGEQITAANAAVNMNKLLQISGGAVYTDDRQVIEFDVRNRLQVVLEVIEEASHKVLVFVPFTHTIELLKEFLTKKKIKCDVIAGKVSVNRRSEIIKQFQQTPDPQVLIIQPQAASHGLTLTAANTIIWYAPVTSVETYLQANARIDRPGQHNPMTIVHVTGSEVEARLYKMLRSNIANHNKIIDLYKQEING